jgi:glycosyltransferase involved in cell wall biosynthesis
MTETYLQQLKHSVESKQLSDKVCFISFVQNVSAMMPIFDALMLTTYSETFGLVLIEAMRANVAVIGSNAGGVLEIIDHEKTGLLFETQNSHDLADKMEYLMKHPQACQRYAQAGYEKAEKMFTSERHFQLLRDIYSGLVR